MNLGEKILELRKKNHITQESLADSLGVSPQAVSKWERGVANPDLYLIPVLSELFAVSADELLGLSLPVEESENTDGLPERREENSRTEARLLYLERLVTMLMSGNGEEALEYALQSAKPLLSFNFTTMTAAERALWKIGHGEAIEAENKMIFKSVPTKNVIGSSYDPQFKNEKLQLENIGAVNRIRIRLRTMVQRPNADVEIFFVTKEHPTWDEKKKLRVRYATNTVSEVNLQFYNPYWFGTLTGLRIDPTNGYADSCELESVMLIDCLGEVRYVCDLTSDTPEKKNWTVENGVRLPDRSALAMHPTPVELYKETHDPQLFIENLDFEIGKCKHVHIRMRTDPENPNLRGWQSNNKFYNALLMVFFKTEASPEFTQQKGVRYDYVAGSGMVDLYVDMSKNGFWNGRLTGLRLDPVEGMGGKFEVECIEILEPSSGTRSASLLKDFEDRVNSLEMLVEELQDTVDDLEGRIDDLESQIEDLEG